MAFALVAATAALSGSPPALPLKPCVLQGSVHGSDPAAAVRHFVTAYAAP